MIGGPTGPRKLARDEHEALRLLARSRDGCTQSLMMAHGFAIGILRDLVRDGLVSEERRSTIAGRRADGGQAGAQSDKGNGPLPPHRVEVGVNSSLFIHLRGQGAPKVIHLRGQGAPKAPRKSTIIYYFKS